MRRSARAAVHLIQKFLGDASNIDRALVEFCLCHGSGCYQPPLDSSTTNTA